MKKCNENGSYNGYCCCNCIHQKKVMKHPWNKGEAQGRITEQLGWICLSPLDDEERQGIFFDREHGMCELHTPREENKNDIR